MCLYSYNIYQNIFKLRGCLKGISLCLYPISISMIMMNIYNNIKSLFLSLIADDDDFLFNVEDMTQHEEEESMC